MESQQSLGGGFYSTTTLAAVESAPVGNGSVWIGWTSGTGPPRQLPEVPYALALPVAGLATWGGLAWLRRRRMP